MQSSPHRKAPLRRIIPASLGVAVLGAAAIRGMVRRFEIRESSMEPAYRPGDWVVARRCTPRRSNTALVRGDVVVFDDPGGTGMHLIKRIIGVPGDEVGVVHGRVTINGALLADRWANGVTAPDGAWSVNDGEVWVLGDHRPVSRSDSRTFGAVPVDTIGWRVVGTYWRASASRE